MNRSDLLELVKLGEGYTLEFKETIGSSLGKEICAFANSSGGKIILGVTDTGEIKGFNLTNSINSQIQDIARNMDPSFHVTIEQVSELVIIYVPEGKEKPYTVNGHFYLRQGSNSQQLKRDEIRNLFQKENQIFFDRKINSQFNISKDFNEEKFNQYIKNANLPDIPKKHLLTNLNIFYDNKLNNAGVLFFCKDVKMFFLNADLVGVLWKGKEKVEIIDKKEFNEDFVSNYESLFKYIVSKLNTEEIIKPFGRDFKLEIPEKALREAILNAMIHRDYYSNSRIQVDIYLDRVEISNPGRLLFDKSDLGKFSILRNPLFADLVFRLNLVEKLGSGIKRIKSLCKENGTNVKFEVYSEWFRVVFFRKMAGTTQETTQETTQQILKYIRENPSITRKELAILIKLSEDGIKYHLERLKKEKVIKHEGSTKKGHWVIIK